MQQWKKVSDRKFECIPDEDSRFVLAVELNQHRLWLTLVDGEIIDRGKTYSTSQAAQRAALTSYYDYWADFEDQG